ncbi:MAG TPA: tyrosine-type recombinase/integrase, partial [Agromyces sp.]
MNLDQLLDDYLSHVAVERGYSPHTVAAYRSDLLELIAFTEARGSTDAAAIDLPLLRDWLWAATERGLARTSIARRAASARGFTAWLTRRGLLDADPGMRLKAPRAQRTLPRVVTEQAVTDVLTALSARAAGGAPTEVRDLAIIELLYASALRVSELVGLDLGDVDRRRRVVRVLGKGSKERMVPYGAPAARAIDRYLDESRPKIMANASENAAQAPATTSAVFLGARGARMGVRSVYGLVAAILAEIPGTGPSGPHAFRHTAATHLLDGGA